MQHPIRIKSTCVCSPLTPQRTTPTPLLAAAHLLGRHGARVVLVVAGAQTRQIAAHQSESLPLLALRRRQHAHSLGVKIGLMLN